MITTPVVEHLQSKHGLARRQLLLTATHTHYGPEFRVDKQSFFNIPPEYAAHLPMVAGDIARAVCEAVDRAINRLEPVRLFIRQTTVGFAHNRRRHGVKDGVASTEDTVDHDIPILECVNSSGVRTAIVFGYACHNTTIPPDDLRYCGDWAGFAKDTLQRANPEAVALYIPGAGADQDPEPAGSIGLSRQHGAELAYAVATILAKQARLEITGPMRAEIEDVALSLQALDREAIECMCRSNDKPQQVKARYLLDALERGDELTKQYLAPVQVIRFGDELLLMAFSGEPVVDWAIKLKRQFGNAEGGLTAVSPSPNVVWVAGYCHDMFGYLPTRRVQREGGYEGGRANLWSAIPAPFTEEVEDLITDAVRRLVQKTGGHEKQ
jgi:hypothetical protein